MSNHDNASGAPEMESPDALDMQRGSENYGSQPDSKTAEPSQASEQSMTTKSQQARGLQALRRCPKKTDELRALGLYQVSARIFGLRALGYSIKTELFNGYAADGRRHARLAQYTLLEPDAMPNAAQEEDEDAKRFATLAAQFAIAGHALIRATKAEAKAPYYVARWGWMRPIKSLDEAEQVLKQIRGAKS